MPKMKILNSIELVLMDQIHNPFRKTPKAVNIIMDFLKSFKYGSTSQLRIECGWKNNADIYHTLKVMEMSNMIRRDGVVNKNSRGRKEIVWAAV